MVFHLFLCRYQYGFALPQGPIEGKHPNGLHVREVAEWMIGRLNLSLGFEETYSRDITDFSAKRNESNADFPETNLIIILSRTQNRLILNEEDLRRKLSAEYGFEAIFVRNEDHTFEEQIAFLRRARIVLAMHGSILVMTMFCRRGK